MTERLSEGVIKRLTKHAAGRETMATDSEVPSLFVRVHPSGVASYVFRHREHGRTYKTPLGRVGALSLADARKAARVYVGKIAVGHDPIAEAKAKAERHRAGIEAMRRAKIETASANAFTVRAMIADWASSRPGDTRSVRYVIAIESGLKHTFAPVLDLPARDLDAERIASLVEAAKKQNLAAEHKKKRGGPAAAARAQVAISLAIKRAIKAGKLDFNPCVRLEAHRLKPRERTMNEAEIKRIWRAAGKMPAPFSAYLRFLLATGVRRNEASRARWPEIEEDRWTIPAGRMKAGREFTVPLTRAALRALPPRGSGDYVFSTSAGARPIGGMTRIKNDLDAAIAADGEGPIAAWRFHDFRRSLATWLSDRGVDYVIADLCLAHSIPLPQAGKVYQRSYKIAERRQALELWGVMLDPDSAESTKPSLRLVAP
jgi:integrase